MFRKLLFLCMRIFISFILVLVWVLILFVGCILLLFGRVFVFLFMLMGVWLRRFFVVVVWIFLIWFFCFLVIVFVYNRVVFVGLGGFLMSCGCIVGLLVWRKYGLFISKILLRKFFLIVLFDFLEWIVVVSF